MTFGAARQVAGNAALLRLEASWLLASIAEGAYLVSLLVFAYEIGGVAAVGFVTLARSLPAGLLAPLLISLVDRFAPARVLLGVHVLRAALIGIVVVVAATDVHPALAIVAAVLEGLHLGVHRATTLAFMPGLARSPEELVAANAAVSLGEGLGHLVGPVAAGLLLVLGGPELGLGLAATAYLGAAAVVATIDAPPSRRTVALDEPASAMAGVVAGFVALRRHRSAGVLIGLFGSQTFVRGALTVLVVAVAVELLNIGQSGVGYLTSAIGAGGLLGAGLAMGIVAGRRLALPFSMSLAAWGMPIVLIGVVPDPVVAFALLCVVGGANATLDVTGFTLLQRCVPNAARGRVFGALESVAAIGISAGAAAAPALVAVVGLQLALVIVGAVLPVLAFASLPLVRRADDASVVPERELGLLRGVPMFAPLPLTMIEHLARHLEPVTFASGEAVIVQGDRGDSFYVVDQGAVDVVHDGRLVTSLGRGEGFGEIALLSERARTASVVAREATTAYRLDRAAFLEAMTGNSRAVLAGEALVASRLAELEQESHGHSH